MRTLFPAILFFSFFIFFNEILLPQSPVIKDPEVTLLDDGFQFVEGPVWKEGLGLLFSDIPANTVYLYIPGSGTSIYLNPSGNSNGLALDSDGSLILAQHGPRQISLLEDDHSLIQLATHYDGKRLNSPNDMALHSNGSIFFTDPPYGLNDQGGISELGFYGIFRLKPEGDVQLLDSTLDRPNGICFSPDEKKLYVSDSESRRIFVWDVIADSALDNKQEFAYMQPAGYADGMKVDRAGFLYVAGPMGIWIYGPEGNAFDTIAVPGQTSNCAWGGEDSTILYVTSGNGIYMIKNRENNPEALREEKPDPTLKLGQSYPNPFTQFAEIPFSLVEPQDIRIEVYDPTGIKITTLCNERLGTGNYTAEWNAGSYKQGLYLIRLLCGNMDFKTDILCKY